MTLNGTLIETAHFWPGLLGRGLVESTIKLYGKNEKLDSLLERVHTKVGTYLIGASVPAADTALEYNEVYKSAKDDLVSKITHSGSVPPTIQGQVNDAFWFMLGYTLPDLIGYAKRKFKSPKINIDL